MKKVPVPSSVCVDGPHPAAVITMPVRSPLSVITGALKRTELQSKSLLASRLTWTDQSAEASKIGESVGVSRAVNVRGSCCAAASDDEGLGLSTGAADLVGDDVRLGLSTGVADVVEEALVPASVGDEDPESEPGGPPPQAHTTKGTIKSKATVR